MDDWDSAGQFFCWSHLKPLVLLQPDCGLEHPRCFPHRSSSWKAGVCWDTRMTGSLSLFPSLCSHRASTSPHGFSTHYFHMEPPTGLLPRVPWAQKQKLLVAFKSYTQNWNSITSATFCWLKQETDRALIQREERTKGVNSLGAANITDYVKVLV